MSNLNPTPGWDNVPQLETKTIAQGGAGGIMNAQAQALLNRTESLNPDNQAAPAALDGTETWSFKKAAGWALASLSAIAGYVVKAYKGITQPGTGGIAQTISAMLAKTLYVSDFDTSAHAVQAALNNRLIVPFGTSLTLTVPAMCADIRTALSAISQWDIFGSVTIQVADGTYTLPGSCYLNHPFGENIHLIGNVATPGNCILQFPTDGAYVPPGFVFGEINGFYFKKTGALSNIGIYTDGGKISKVGPNLTVDGFYYGISARNGGVILATGTSSAAVVVKNAGDVGIWAFLNSYVNCEYANVSGCKDAANNLGGGIVAEFASSIDATGATSSGNYLVGISSISGSSIRAWNTTVSGNGGASGMCAGYYVASMGTMEIFGGSTTGNTGYGYATDGRAEMAGQYSGIANTGNTLGTMYDPMQLKSDGTTSVNSGSLAINSTGPNATGGATYLDQNIPASQFSIQRFLTAGAEVWRKQFRNDSNQYQWSAGAVTGMVFHPIVGRLSAGVSAPAVGATDGFFAIPKMPGAPTGAAVNDSGYAPIVFDSVNGKLWVWNGSAWKGVALA